METDEIPNIRMVPANPKDSIMIRNFSKNNFSYIHDESTSSIT